MALPGFYKVNFTDPRKEGFIIEPYQTNGAISPVSQILDINAPRADTSLLLYGRDVPNYGERVAENFVQLLENFAGPAQPQNPIEGQLWFDTGTIYTVSGWSSATTLFFIGDLVDVFTAFIASNAQLTLSFNPINSSVDNTFQQVSVIVTATASAGVGATSVTFAAPNGDGISLPTSVIGGFISAAAPGYSRMRVATNVSNVIKWVDITNVISSVDAPAATTLTVGDLWYDSQNQQLKVYGTSGWSSVAGKYLPLTGGTLTGTLDLGINKAFSTGTITAASGDLYALVNRSYVDGVGQGLQTQIDTINATIATGSGSTGTALAGKVSKTGDQMTGTLLFGDGTATSSISRGVDAGNNPIVRPLITWNSNDYLTAATQTNYVVDKNYIAKALNQHLLDAQHGGGGFIQIQPDGSGVFPNNIAFSAGATNKTYSLSWFDSSGNNNHSIYGQFSGATSQLTIQAGNDSADSVDIRHSSIPTGLPLFRFGLGSSMSYQTMYLLDGQPQPVYNGVVTANNDDTAAAAKGFVRKYVADNLPAPVSPGTTVTGASYTYNTVTKQYTLTLNQSAGTPDLTVNEYHKHDPYDIPYTYKPVAGFDWIIDDSLVSMIPTTWPTYPNLDVGTMLEVLNTYKVSVKDAMFVNPPAVGIDTDVIEYNSAAKTVRIAKDFSASIKVGGSASIQGSSGNDGVYTVTAVVSGGSYTDVDGNVILTTLVTVAQSLPFNGVEPIEGALFLQGTYVAATQQHEMITRTTLDYEIASSTKTNYLYTKLVSAGTNVVVNVGFTYTPNINKLWVFRNGQKLRVNTLTGGDYNETSSTSITIASVFANDEFEIYKI